MATTSCTAQDNGSRPDQISYERPNGHLLHPNAHRTPPGMPHLIASGPTRDPVLIYPTYRIEFSLSKVRPENMNPNDFYYNPIRIPNEGAEHDRFLSENQCADVSLRSAISAFQTPAIRRKLRAISCLVEPLFYVEYLGNVPSSFGKSLSLNFYREFGEEFDVSVANYRELMNALVSSQDVTLDNGQRQRCEVLNSSALETLFDAVSSTVRNTAHRYGRGRALGLDRSTTPANYYQPAPLRNRDGTLPRSRPLNYRPTLGTAWSRAQINCFENASRTPLEQFLESDIVIPPRRMTH